MLKWRPMNDRLFYLSGKVFNSLSHDQLRRQVGRAIVKFARVARPSARVLLGFAHGLTILIAYRTMGWSASLITGIFPGWAELFWAGNLTRLGSIYWLPYALSVSAIIAIASLLYRVERIEITHSRVRRRPFGGTGVYQPTFK